MTGYEAEAYARGVRRRIRAGWEQARYVAYYSLLPWAKDLQIADMIEFPWEKDTPLDDDAEAAALDSLMARVPEYTKFIKEKMKE